MLEENDVAVENISDETNQASSEPETTASTSEGKTVEAKEMAETETTKDVPFHEHPRFKELIEQKNAYEQRSKAMEEKYAQMERQLQELSKPKDMTPNKREAMINRLKGIDPEFADFISELAPVKSLEEMKNALMEQQQTQFRTQAVSEITKMHSENKIDPTLQAKYNQELELAYQRGQIRSMDDVKTIYKNIHDGYTKLLEDIRRRDRQSYVADKKTDTKAPTSQPKGKMATPAKPQFSKNKEEARAQIVAQYLAERTAGNDV